MVVIFCGCFICFCSALGTQRPKGACAGARSACVVRSWGLILINVHACRYYGKSLPCGKEKVRQRMQYLSAEQAMADYAELVSVFHVGYTYYVGSYVCCGVQRLAHVVHT